ncbi:MAG: PEGA domain-containing protein [Bacteroidales bacterium]
MRRKISLLVLSAIVLVGLALAPTPAEAQWHHGGGHVYVGGYWGYPYWGWGPYWGYPYLGWGGWYGYPYYGYPDYPDNSGEVRLEITPRDAQVYVDGYFVGIVDDFDGIFQRLHLSPGDHELVIYKPGFRTIKQTLRLNPRQDSKVKYAMQALAPGEKAEEPPPPPPQEQRSQRADALGRTPRGYPPPRTGEAAPPREMPPAAAEASAFGSLVLRVQPAGAEVLIDGERWEGPEGDDRLVVQVSEGSHRVEIRKEGFVTFTKDITVRAGETTPLNVSLPRRGE